MNGGVPSKELDESNNQHSLELLDVLNKLAINRDLLNNPSCIQHIMLLLGAGANRNIQDQNGKTLLHYLDEKLSDILDQLASNRDLLDNSDCIQYIMRLLGAGADPDARRNHNKKTLLHYVAERNDIDGIRFLLGKRANPNVQDQDGKAPFEYVTKYECRQAIRDLSYVLDGSYENEGSPTDGSSNDPKQCYLDEQDSGCNSDDENQITSTKLSDSDSDKDQDHVSDDSCENKGNHPSDHSKQHCHDKKHNDNQAPHDGPRYSFDDGNQIIFTELSDCDQKDKNSSRSASNKYPFLEDSLLMKLEIPLTKNEEGLIKKFCDGIKEIAAQNEQKSEESILESIEDIVNKYLKEGVRLNSSCSNDNKNDDEKGDKETVTSLILKEIEGVISQLRVNPRSSTAILNTCDFDCTDESDGDEYKASDIIIKKITSNLLLKGGIEKGLLFYEELASKHYDCGYLDDLGKQYQDRKKELESVAYEGIVGRDRQAQKGKPEAVEVDNRYFYVKYSQDSIIEPAKIFNKAKDLRAEALNLEVGILQIGESIVRVESIEEKNEKKRNYTDILKGSIEMSFTTEVGEISICLCHSKEKSNEIKVEFADEESKARFDKLGDKKKKSLGENCLLGGKNVLKAIEDKGFERNGSVPTESTKTIEDISSALTQVHLRQEKKAIAVGG